jgi:DNA-directed RNA polymerase specialized sigma24 family protein
MAAEDENEYASEAEIRSAIEALGTDRLKALEWGRTLLKLRGKFAYGRFAEGREPEDLYNEALTRIWEGARTGGVEGRRWKPKQCTFLDEVLGTMMSVASHLAEKYGEEPLNVPKRASDFAKAEGEGSFADVTEAVPSNRPTAEEAYAATEALRQLEDLVKDDKEESEVLTGMRLGMTESEIAQATNLPVKRVHAAIARIWYKISTRAG